MRILILNLTRMGDLLQTTPLIMGLKRKYPQSEITLVVIDDFRGICGGFPGIDRIFSVDVNHFIPKLVNPKYSLEEHYTYLEKLLRRIGTGYDLIINLSHTRISAVFSRLFDCEDTRGMTLSKDGALVVRHPWLNYFFYVSRNRLLNTINLVDMYSLAGDTELRERNLHYQVPEEAKDFAKKYLEGRKGEFIGFQLGTSTGDRRWEPQYFGELANLIYERLGWNIVVLGHPSEAKLLEELKRTFNGPIIDAIGKTTIPQLAGLLEKCRLLVTNDTGTMHLATAVGTGVVAVFLGEARACDTGPFTEKALVLEANIPCAPCAYNTTCLDHICHRCVKAEDVFWAIENFNSLISGEIEQMPESPSWENLKLSRPLFEADGFYDLAPLIRRSLNVETLLKRLYRSMWKRFLNPEIPVFEFDLDKFYDQSKDSNFNSKIEELILVFRQLANLGALGVKLGDKMRQAGHPPDIPALKRLTKEMIILDNTIYQMEMTRQETAPITVSFRIKKNNVESDDIDYIAGMAETLYGEIKIQAELMAEQLEMYLTECEKSYS